MAKGVRPRVKVPKSASAGDVVTIKCLISHPMESGQRKDKDGKVVRTQEFTDTIRVKVSGDSLTAVLESGPAKGVLTLNGNGSFTFDPNDEFTALDVGEGRGCHRDVRRPADGDPARADRRGRWCKVLQDLCESAG